jgi:uncharacterized damage-inducible protein DinB
MQLRCENFVHIPDEVAQVAAAVKKSEHSLCRSFAGSCITCIPYSALTRQVGIDFSEESLETCAGGSQVALQAGVVFAHLAGHAHLFQLHVELENLFEQIRGRLAIGSLAFAGVLFADLVALNLEQVFRALDRVAEGAVGVVEERCSGKAPLLLVRRGASEAVWMQAAAEAVEFTLQGCGVNGEGALQAEGLVVIDAGGGLDFAARGTEEWRGAEGGVARPAAERVGHAFSLVVECRIFEEAKRMDIAYFRRLFRYDQWANGQVLTAMHAAEQPPQQSVRWLAHLAGAGSTWLARLKQETPRLAIWPELTLEESAGYLRGLGQEWLAYMDTLEPADLSKNIDYKNSKGMEFSVQIVDILTHVVAHGTYHRGQIAANMRAEGAAPAVTDFIAAVWMNVLEE